MSTATEDREAAANLPDVIVIMSMDDYVALSSEQMLSLRYFIPEGGTVGVNKEKFVCWFKNKDAPLYA